MLNFPKKIINKLNKRKQENSLRKLTIADQLIDFCSNDYLGMARNSDLHELIWQDISSHSYPNGATGSRLLTGNSLQIKELEEKLASFFVGEQALLFNSGYIANQSVLSSIPQRGDVILYDELVHASIKDGMRLSFATKQPFKHNDLSNLHALLEKHKNATTYVVVESIYSMDGDMCPIRQVVSICESFGAHVIVDEAHSTGVIGIDGSGLAVKEGLEERIFARIYTFGKGMGVHGACAVGSTSFCDFLINFARPFIYTTALPPHSLVAISHAFNYLSKNKNLIENLQKNINFYNKNIINDKNHNINSPIQIVEIPTNEQVKKKAAQLQNAGLDIRPILSPTVSEGNERLRICIHNFNTKEEMNHLVNNLNGHL